MQLMTRDEMAEEWGIHPSLISQVTKDISPVDYRWNDGRRPKGLYRPQEVAEVFAEDFREKRRFMETAFLEQNNQAFGYERFDYLYLEDSVSENERLTITHQKIIDFFGE